MYRSLFIESVIINCNEEFFDTKFLKQYTFSRKRGIRDNIQKWTYQVRNVNWYRTVVLVAFPFAFNSQNVECIQSEIQRHENSFYYYATKIRHFKASYESSRLNSVVKKCSTSLKYVSQSYVSNESRYKKIAVTIWLELKGKLEKRRHGKFSWLIIVSRRFAIWNSSRKHKSYSHCVVHSFLQWIPFLYNYT